MERSAGLKDGADACLFKNFKLFSVLFLTQVGMAAPASASMHYMIQAHTIHANTRLKVRLDRLACLIQEIRVVII